MKKKVGSGNENNGPEKDSPELGRGVHGRQLVRVEEHDAPPSPGPAHPETSQLAPNRDPPSVHVPSESVISASLTRIDVRSGPGRGGRATAPSARRTGTPFRPPWSRSSSGSPASWRPSWPSCTRRW